MPPTICTSNSLLQAISDAFPYPLLEFLGVLAPEATRLDIRRGLVVWRRKHRDDGEEDRLGGLHGGPALRSRFVAVLVVTWRVEDGDADFAIRVD